MDSDSKTPFESTPVDSSDRDTLTWPQTLEKMSQGCTTMAHYLSIPTSSSQDFTMPLSPKQAITDPGVQSNRNASFLPLKSIPEYETQKRTGKCSDQTKSLGGTPQARPTLSQRRKNMLLKIAPELPAPNNSQKTHLTPNDLKYNSMMKL